MLPSLSRLPVGAPGPAALEDDFMPMFLLRHVDPSRPKANEVLNGRVVDARGNPQHVMDEAERWRHKQLERMNRRRSSGVDRLPGYRTTHRTDPIPPVQWEKGMEVYADGALVNVRASILNVPEASVSVGAVRQAAHDATEQSVAELAQTVTDISNTDGGTTLGWWAFVERMRRAVPALRSKRNVMWLIGAMYSLYLLKEEAERGQPAPRADWADWNAITGSVHDARLDGVLVSHRGC